MFNIPQELGCSLALGLLTLLTGCGAPNFNEQLGTQGEDVSRESTHISFPRLLARGDTTIAIHESLMPWGWGRNSEGQLRQLSDRQNKREATPLRFVTSTQEVDAAEAQLRAGSKSVALSPTGMIRIVDAPNRPILQQIGVGSNFDCSLPGHPSMLRCTGPSNGSGQLGTSRLVNPIIPWHYIHTSSENLNWNMVAAGSLHACALNSNSELYCWGDNTHGAVGSADPSSDCLFSKCKAEATKVAGKWRWVAANAQGTCGLDENGAVHCWGDVPGREDATSIPKAVAGTSEFESLSLGKNAICGITGAQKLYCWGDATDELSLASMPTRIGTERWIAVATGDNHVCAIRNDGGLFCMGDNRYGQLGTETTQTFSHEFVQVAFAETTGP